MFRDPEKSPGLSLLWGAGPQQRQPPGLPLPSAPPRPAPQGACVCACVCDGEPPRTPVVCLSVCVCYPGQDGPLWSPGAETGRTRASPDPVCEAHQGRGGAQVFRKLSPLTGPQTLKVGPGQRVPLGSRDQGLGAADGQGRIAMKASPGGPEGAPTLGGRPQRRLRPFPTRECPPDWLASSGTLPRLASLLQPAPGAQDWEPAWRREQGRTSA